MSDYKPLTGSYDIERVTLGELDYIETRAGCSLSSLQAAPRQAPFLEALAMVAGRREYGHNNYTLEDAKATPMRDIFKAWNLDEHPNTEPVDDSPRGVVEVPAPDRF